MAKPEYKYVLAPRGVTQGDVLHSGAGSPIKAGNTLPLSAIPIGMEIHNVELYPGRGGQLARAAGTAAVLMGKGACKVQPLFPMAVAAPRSGCVSTAPFLHLFLRLVQLLARRRALLGNPARQ